MSKIFGLAPGESFDIFGLTAEGAHQEGSSGRTWSNFCEQNDSKPGLSFLGLPKFVHLWIFDKAKWAICQANRLRTVRIGVWLPCFCDKKQTISCLSIRSSPRPTHISRYIGKKMSNTHTHTPLTRIYERGGMIHSIMLHVVIVCHGTRLLGEYSSKLIHDP